MKQTILNRTMLNIIKHNNAKLVDLRPQCTDTLAGQARKPCKLCNEADKQQAVYIQAVNQESSKGLGQDPAEHPETSQRAATPSVASAGRSPWGPSLPTASSQLNQPR
jgi:hypothetical protein